MMVLLSVKRGNEESRSGRLLVALFWLCVGDNELTLHVFIFKHVF